MKIARQQFLPSTWPLRTCAVAIAVLLAAGCSGHSAPSAATATPTGNDSAAASGDAAAPTHTRATADTSASDQTSALGGRSGVLTNPEKSQMVFLYYDLAGIPPPIDTWVEHDQRVEYAPGADKAENRAHVRAELSAGLAAVKNVGVLQLTTDAQLSAYDPTYGEFTLGALAPASEYGFEAFGEHVAVKFDNGLDAQSWSVPKAAAQDITDRYTNQSLRLDVTLKIVQVLPGAGGGTLVTHVVSWNLHTPDGKTIARVTVGHHD